MPGGRAMELRRLLDAVYDGAAYLAAACVFMIFAIMVVGSVMRIAGLRTGGTDDLVAWFCAAAGFLAMAHTFRRGDFVRMTLVIERLGPAARRRTEAACLAILAASVAFMAVAACRFAYESYDFNDIANGMLAMPLWIPQLSFVVGALLLLVAVVDELVTALRGRTPRYILAVQERHARGDFSEDL